MNHTFRLETRSLKNNLLFQEDGGGGNINEKSILKLWLLPFKNM